MTNNENGNGYKLIRNLLITVASGLILNIPVSIWWASSINADVNKNQEAIQELKKEIKDLRNTISSSMDDRYRGSDAKDDFKIRDEKIEHLESRVRENEKKIAKLVP